MPPHFKTKMVFHGTAFNLACEKVITEPEERMKFKQNCAKIAEELARNKENNKKVLLNSEDGMGKVMDKIRDALHHYNELNGKVIHAKSNLEYKQYHINMTWDEIKAILLHQTEPEEILSKRYINKE